MAINNEGQAIELTNRIQEMTEGESPEVLEEIVRLLNYHAGYHAGTFDGQDSLTTILTTDINNLILMNLNR